MSSAHTPHPTLAPPGGTIPPPRRGRPRGPFTQSRRLEMLRALLLRHPKGLTIYELSGELGLTPRSLRRYLAHVKRDLELTAVAPKPGGAVY